MGRGIRVKDAGGSPLINMKFFKNLFLDAFWLVVYFPIWWYGEGLKEAAVFCWRRIKGGWRGLALGILFENFFRPMYGERGWDAYVLSLFVRSWQIFWRSLFFVFLFVFWTIAFALWPLLPLLAVWGMI